MKKLSLLLLLCIAQYSLANPPEDNPYFLELEKVSHSMTELQQQKDESFQLSESELTTLGQALNEKLSNEQIKVNYNKVKSIWGNLATEIIKSEPRQLDSFSPLPAPGESNKELIEQISSLRAKLIQKQERAYKTEHQLVQKQFSKASLLRSKYIKLSMQQGGSSLFSWDQDYVSDVKKELFLVPLRLQTFIANKSTEFKNYLYGGFYGLTQLIKELFIILLVLISPIFIFKLLKVLTDYLDKVRSQFIRKSYRQKEYGSFALWIRRINPFVPWVLFYFAVGVASWALSRTTIHEPFEVIAPYVEYYIFYRVFRLLIELGLSQITRRNRGLQQLKTKKRMNETSQFIGRFFLFIMFVLHTFEISVGEGLVYLQVSAVAWWVGYFMISKACVAWKDEISHFLKSISPNPALQKFANFCEGKYGILTCFPAVLFIFAYTISMWIFSWGQRFDLIKKLSLKLLRIRLESGQKKSGEAQKKIQIPEDYSKNFKDFFKNKEDFWVEPKPGFSHSVYSHIKRWAEGDGDDESILAIYGERGLGKTRLLKQLAKISEKDKLKTHHIDVTQKITSSESINKYFSRLLEVDFENPDLEIQTDEEGAPTTAKEKTIVFVDNAQNLFLAQLGGFDGLEAFIQLINSKAKDIFWCITFAEQSWVYLNYVLGKHHYFRTEVKLPRWTDDAIQKLIMNGHNSTDYKVNFDEVLYAATSGNMDGEVVNIEDRFFDLLWEQSQGNPEVASHLWLKAINQVKGKNLTFTLPKSVDVSAMSELNDEMYFLFTSIFRHENLTIKEAMESNNLPFGMVRQAFYRGFEEGLLENMGNQRFRISTQWTHSLLKQLKRKNMIYGN